jgi:hypothetical protein
MVASGAFAAACAGNPVAPNSDEHMAMVPVPAPTPAAGMIVLKGRVTQSAPTTHAEIAGATVSIVDGPNSGKSAVANGMGFYTIGEVAPGSFTVAVAANGFVGASKRVDAVRDAVENFNLTPESRMLTYTFHGDVRDGDGTCSDGAAQRPCRIVMIPIHNAGNVNARLEWTSDQAIDLDLALFQTNVAAPIEKSAQKGADAEQVGSHVTGGSNYELRITYAGGNGQAKYTISIECPN